MVTSYPYPIEAWKQWAGSPNPAKWESMKASYAKLIGSPKRTLSDEEMEAALNDPTIQAKQQAKMRLTREGRLKQFTESYENALKAGGHKFR